MLRSKPIQRWLRAAATSSLPRSTHQATATAAQQNLLSSAGSRPFAFNNAIRLMSSSFGEPASLFEDKDPLTSDKFPVLSQEDRDAPLRSDVRTMGSRLGRIIQDQHGSQIFDKIEELRALAKNFREAGAGRIEESAEEAAAALDELANACSELSNEDLRIVARAFTHFLAIANAAEGHHRVRLLSKQIGDDGLPNKADSCGGVLRQLVEEGRSADEIYDCLTTQNTELVLTAHPTEVNRRTILEKQRRVQQVSD